MKKILLATRPLVPPWDEASKNFAYFLAKSMESHHVSILTTPTWLPDLPANVTQIPCYTKNELDFSEKLRLLSALRGLRNKFDITHYLFTPTRKNTSLINFFSRPTHGKTIQTIATLREDLYGAKQWRQLLFADRIIVYSDYSKQILERVGFDNVTRIYPGIDLSLYQPEVKDADALAFFHLTPEDFVVMYPGEYVRLGATDMLTEWLITYYQSHPDSNMKFVFACRVKHEDDRLKKVEITERFAAADILDRIRFTDTYADMPKLYNLADIMVFPVGDMRGKFDVPLVIIEAYACGKRGDAGHHEHHHARDGVRGRHLDVLRRGGRRDLPRRRQVRPGLARGVADDRRRGDHHGDRRRHAEGHVREPDVRRDPRAHRRGRHRRPAVRELRNACRREPGGVDVRR